MTPVLMKKEKLENGTTISYPVIPMKGSFGFQFIIDEYGQPNFQVLKLINGPMNIGGGNIGIGNNVWVSSVFPLHYDNVVPLYHTFF